MRRRFVVSLEEFERLLQEQKRALEKLGVDIKGLIAYSLHAATYSDYQSLQQYLIHDLLEDRPDLHASVLHRCMDFVGEASALMVSYLTPILGGFDHTVRLEQFLGRDAVISVQVSD